jgi:hypothetical protein
MSALRTIEAVVSAGWRVSFTPQRSGDMVLSIDRDGKGTHRMIGLPLLRLEGGYEYLAVTLKEMVDNWEAKT